MRALVRTADNRILGYVDAGFMPFPGTFLVTESEAAGLELAYPPPPPGMNHEPPPVPASVPRWKARAALRAFGLLDTVEAAIAQSEAAMQEWWAAGQEIDRESPGVARMALALGLDADTIDDLFRAAAAVEV